MTTMQEQLDELVAMAREAGQLSQRAADVEHKRDCESGDRRRELGVTLRSARKELQRAESALASARTRFLARHGAS